jgi:hypothetical protein
MPGVQAQEQSTHSGERCRRTALLLWKASLGGQIVNARFVRSRRQQYVATIAGISLRVFGLRE